MGIINICGKIPTVLMNVSSSIFSTASSYLASGFSSFMSIIFTFLAKLFFFISKWMLYLLDIIYSFIQQLCGLNISYESLDTLVSAESDMVFNMLISAKNTITPIVKSLIAIAVALIIFFSILAIIKTQFNSLKNGPADIKGVFRSTLRAFVLLIITPMIAIAGIVVSNTILKTFYIATNPSGANSISTQLFSASATSASAYRAYAQKGYRIPITFDYTEQMEILEYFQDPKNEITNEFREYVESSENLIYVGYMMFKENNFDSYDALNDTTGTNQGVAINNVKNYHKLFDRTLEAYNAADNSYLKYKKITSYKPEYYVMADVIDYGINSGNPLYLKTIEEMLRSVALLGNDENVERRFNYMISMYNIEFLDENLQRIKLKGSSGSSGVTSDYSTWKEVFMNDINWKIIRFTSSYYDADETSTPYRKMDIEYNHVRGETDEINGAKYIMTTEDEISIGGVIKTYFNPLTERAGGFESDFIQMGQLISAKGIFSDAIYPTAIRQSVDGVEVQFYRYNLKTITVGDADDAVGGSVKADKEEKSGIAAFFDKIASLFNPKVSGRVDKDKIVTAYTYDELIVNHVASGKLSLSYMFEDDFTNFIGGAVTGLTNAVRSVSGKDSVEQIGVFGLRLENVFIANKLNILVLFVGAFILIKVTFAAVFSLINRIYELFLIIMIYPTACATIPIDENGYKEWTRAYTQRLFSTYGIILGLNFVLMLFPIISEIKVFNAGDIAMSAPVRRFRNLFSLGGLISISYDFLANFLNLITIILFELVAFTLLETMPDMIQNIIGVPGAKGGINPIETLGKAMKITASVISAIVSSGSSIFKNATDIIKAIGPAFGKKAKEKKAQARERLKEKSKKFVPGSAVVNEVKDKKFLKEKKKEKDRAKDVLDQELNEAQDETDPKKRQEMINNAYKKYEDAQKNYNDALKNTTEARKADEQRKKEEHRSGTSDRDEDDAKDDDETDTSFRSKSDLKKAKKRQQAIVDHLKYKEKYGGGLTEEERMSLMKNEERLAKTEEALKKKSDESMSRGDKRKLRKLQKKNKKEGLTTEEQIKFDELQEKRDGEIKQNKENKIKSKQKNKDFKAEVKQNRKNVEQEKKNDDRALKLKSTFSKSNAAAKIKQKHFFKQMDKDKLAIQQFADKHGAGQDVENMSEEELLEMVQNADGVNPIKKKQLESIIGRYSQSRDMNNELLDTQERHQNRKSNYKANAEMMKHRNKVDHRDRLINRAGRKIFHKQAGSDKFEAKLRSKEDEIQNELDVVNEQLEKMGPVDGSNFSQYQKLKKQQQELLGKQKFQQRFENYNAKSPEELKQKLKDEKRDRKMHVKANNQVKKENGGNWSKTKADAKYNEIRKKYERKQRKKEEKKARKRNDI